MTVPAALTALAVVLDAPATASPSKRNVALAREATEPLRELATELDDLVGAVEQAADDLEEANREDREDALDALLSSVEELASVLRTALA